MTETQDWKYRKKLIKIERNEKKRDIYRQKVKDAGYSGHLNQFGYEFFTQDSEEHQKDYIMALNNRFPNLVGFGILQYMKQLWALNPRAKLMYNKENIEKWSRQMNVDRKIMEEFLTYCLDTLGIFTLTHTWYALERTNYQYIMYPDFVTHLLWLQAKKIHQETEIKLNKYKNEGVGRTTAKQQRSKMIESMRPFLLLKKEMKKEIEAYFPLLGEPETLFDLFKQEVYRDYQKWYEILTPQNYRASFIAWLNNQPMSKAEILKG